MGLAVIYKRCKAIIWITLIIVIIALVIKCTKTKSQLQQMLNDDSKLMASLDRQKLETARGNHEGEDDSYNTNTEDRTLEAFLRVSNGLGVTKINPKTAMVAKRKTEKMVRAIKAHLHGQKAQLSAGESSYQNTMLTEDDTTETSDTRTIEEKWPAIKRSSNKSEEECRAVFEQYFDAPFETARPGFLRNPKSGRNLELDGYNAARNLAFEYQGIQHSVYPNPFHKTQEQFETQQANDEFKRQRLAEVGIQLIEIDHTVKFSDLRTAIHTSLKRLGYKPTKKDE